MMSQAFGHPVKESPKLGNVFYYVQEHKHPKTQTAHKPMYQKFQCNFFPKSTTENFRETPLHNLSLAVRAHLVHSRIASIIITISGISLFTPIRNVASFRQFGTQNILPREISEEVMIFSNSLLQVFSTQKES